jgi:hypothetical protein
LAQTEVRRDELIVDNSFALGWTAKYVGLLVGIDWADEGCKNGSSKITNELLAVDLSAIVLVGVGSKLVWVEGYERDVVSSSGRVFMLLIELEFVCLWKSFISSRAWMSSLFT